MEAVEIARALARVGPPLRSGTIGNGLEDANFNLKELFWHFDLEKVSAAAAPGVGCIAIPIVSSW